MSETIAKHIGEGFGKGELYAALAYDSTDAFGGMSIKALMLNSTGRISFLDANAYIYSSATTVLDIVATTINLTGSIVTASTIASTADLAAGTQQVLVDTAVAADASTGNFIPLFVETEISADSDISGTAQLIGIDSQLTILGDDSNQTTWSSTGACCAIAAYYYTNNDDINITNGVHSCIMCAPYYGDDYVMSGAADFAGLFLFQCGNASATVGSDVNSAILVGRNTGADTWGSVINIAAAGVVDYMFNLQDDDVLSGYNSNTATTGNPDGFIKIIIGGQTSYIWTYTNIA